MHGETECSLISRDGFARKELRLIVRIVWRIFLAWSFPKLFQRATRPQLNCISTKHHHKHSSDNRFFPVSS